TRRLEKVVHRTGDAVCRDHSKRALDGPPNELAAVKGRHHIDVLLERRHWAQLRLVQEAVHPEGTLLGAALGPGRRDREAVGVKLEGVKAPVRTVDSAGE